MPMLPTSDDPAGRDEVTLESGVRLSDSVVWRLQRDSYLRRGLRAWTEDMVPHFITNNPFFAEVHARIVFGFICDCLEPGEKEPHRLAPQKRMRILELGAGTGKFSFLFLRHLETLLRSRDFPLERVSYCLTDCSESLIETWRANPYLAEFAERKILEFEVFDASQQISPRFLAANAQSREPRIVIANYFFDSLPQDAFLIKEGQIFEFLQTTKKIGQGAAQTAPESLKDLQFSYTTVAVPENRYEDNSWNVMIDSYRRALPNATVLFPSRALTTLQAIAKSTDGPMLVLASDKGFVHQSDLALAQGPPAFDFHAPNVFSQMVNFHAIAQHFAGIGGQALLPAKHSLNLNTCTFLLDRTNRSFPATKAEYQQTQSAFGSDDLFALLAWLNPHIDEMAVPQILALLRLSRWDPITLTRVFPALARQIHNAPAQRDDLRNAVLLTWANHFPLTQNDNVLAFYSGVLLLELRFFEEAASMFKTSNDSFGSSAATSYNLGLCSSALGRPSEALAFMIEACHLDPAFEPAQRSLRKLQGEQSVQ
jgi:hypothetical protein